MGRNNLYYTLETASKITDSVLVGFSGGKDTICCHLRFVYEVFQKCDALFHVFSQGIRISRENNKILRD